MTPIRIQQIRMPAGPPLWRADPDPTNKPVPILPPVDDETLGKENRLG
jgi:hypothetical protein